MQIPKLRSVYSEYCAHGCSAKQALERVRRENGKFRDYLQVPPPPPSRVAPPVRGALRGSADRGRVRGARSMRSGPWT